MKFDILFYKFIVLRCEPYAGSAAEVEVGAEQSEFVNLETIAEVRRSFIIQNIENFEMENLRKKNILIFFFSPVLSEEKTRFNWF